VINRLREVLPEQLLRDLVLDDDSPSPAVNRPNVERFIAVDPSEAIRSSDIGYVLEQELEPLERCGITAERCSTCSSTGSWATSPTSRRSSGWSWKPTSCSPTSVQLDPNYLWGVYRPRRG
jgi:hypothetical protein